MFDATAERLVELGVDANVDFTCNPQVLKKKHGNQKFLPTQYLHVPTAPTAFATVCVRVQAKKGTTSPENSFPAEVKGEGSARPLIRKPRPQRKCGEQLHSRTRSMNKDHAPPLSEAPLPNLSPAPGDHHWRLVATVTFATPQL